MMSISENVTSDLGIPVNILDDPNNNTQLTIDEVLPNLKLNEKQLLLNTQVSIGLRVNLRGIR